MCRSDLSKNASKTKWNPFTLDERDRAAMRARLIYTKARLVALEGSQERLECVQSPYLGALDVRRPRLMPIIGDGTLSFAAGGICFLQPFEEQARREISRPGGREVDRSDPSGTSYKDQLVYCQLPIAPSED